MTDHDENQDQAPPEYARELAELLNLLDDVDRQITPEHVARRSRELLGAPGNDVPSAPAASGGDLEHFLIAFESHLHGLGAIRDQISPAALADSLMSPALREATSARTVARRQYEAACRRAEAMQDTALAKAARIEAAAREKAARIVDEARAAAAQVAAAARTEAEEIKAAARAHPGGRGDHLFLCTVADRLKAMADLAAVGKLSSSAAEGTVALRDSAALARRVRWQQPAVREGFVAYARWGTEEAADPTAGFSAPFGLVVVWLFLDVLDEFAPLAAGIHGAADAGHVVLSLERPGTAVVARQQVAALPVPVRPHGRHPEPPAAIWAEMPTAAADLGIVLLPY